MEDERVISYERGKQLADQLGLEFFETSAKENINVKVNTSNSHFEIDNYFGYFLIRLFLNDSWTLFAIKCQKAWTAILIWSTRPKEHG